MYTLRLCLHKDISHIFLLQNVNQDDIKHFLKKKVNLSDESLFQTAATGLRRVQRGGYAFHCEASTANPIIRETFETIQLCDLNDIPFRRNVYLGMTTRRGDPFKEMYGNK